MSVLIPITMVSGTAWFAVSLSNIKMKFEPFGNELTVDLYRSFMTSLVFLSLMTVVALNPNLFLPISAWGKQFAVIPMISGIFGTLIVLKMIYDVFSGATKYDMNDSMLTGQHEAAEKFYKRSLSLLNSCGSQLKTGISAGATGYFVGLAFYEVFNYILLSKGDHPEVREIIFEIGKLKSKPPSTVKEIKTICVSFIEKFLSYVTNIADGSTQKSYKNIQLELSSIRENPNENQEVLNLRLATILEEMEDMLTGQGEALFTKRLEIEKKFLVKTLPDLESLEKTDILQGYLASPAGDELRIRKMGSNYLRTHKRSYPSGYREEIEEFIPHEEFDNLWPQTQGKRIEKTRYKIPYRELIIELDVFSGHHKGLALAEVEFHSEQEADSFSPPEWFGKEVTLDPKYKNANLAN